MYLACKKCKYQENAKIKKSYERLKYGLNPEIKEVCRKRYKKIEYQNKKLYEKNPELHKRYKNIRYWKYQENKKSD